MSDEKMVTEREAVKRERNAFYAGAHTLATINRIGFFGDEIHEEGNQRYPLPKVTRPRIANEHDNLAWRLRDARHLEYRRGDGAWTAVIEYADAFGAFHIGTERIRLWADLLANPTETVEDDT